MKFLFSFFCLCSLISNEVDILLKNQLDDSPILSTRQIQIPGYPSAFNPSIIPYKNGYLLSFRIISRYPGSGLKHRSNTSFIGLAKLDKKFKVSEKSVQILPIQSHSLKFSLTAEDARLIPFGNRILIFFNDHLPLIPKTFAMYFGELIEEDGIFKLKEPAKLLQYPFSLRIEKNWSPFVSGDQLYLIYADDPRTILQVDQETGYCQQAPSTTPQWEWDWGIIRGGTPAYRINGSFLTFFHSSFPVQTSKGRAYVMGAYLFDPAPPFTVRHMNPQPLGALADYKEDNPSKVVFPCGLIVQEKQIIVTWGKSDKQIYLTLFDREKLLNSMVPVSQ